MLTPASRAAVVNHILTTESYRRRLSAAARLAPPPAVLVEAEPGEVQKYFTLNQTGNIMVSSTVENEKDVSDDVKQVFRKAIVFFGAWTAALAKAGKTLYDYEAITQMIEKSGFFVQVHGEDRSFVSESGSITLDTQIVSSVLGGFASMGGTTALSIAQTVLGSLGSKLKLSGSSTQDTNKIAHLLFVCENLMGMPILNVLLFNTSASQTKTVTGSNCHSSVAQGLTMTYHQDAFMFVDPDYIDKFTSAFQTNPEYDALIQKLAGYIDKPKTP